MCSRGANDFLALKMYGLLTSDAFQRAKVCAEILNSYLPKKFPSPEVHGLFDVDWNEYLLMQRRENGGKWWALHRPVAVFVNERFIGSEEDMFVLLSEYCVFDIPPEHVPYDIGDYLNPNRSYCYMDITVGGRQVGSFTFELFDDVLPNTCDNFRRLCTGKPSYKDSQIHRIAIPSFIQGGILQSGQVPFFCDENYSVSHDKRGILSMANDGVNTNNSQFFIILSPATWMDRKYVAFGRLVEGWHVLQEIEQVPTYYEMPTERIRITACGLKYASPTKLVEAEVKPEEVTTEMLVRSMLDEIIEKMTAAEVELPDERDAESVLIMEKYKRGEYSAGVTEDMLSDVDPLDEDLPESLKIVWLLLRDMVGDKTLIRAFARKLVEDIVEAVFKQMRVKDAFSGLLEALKKLPGQLMALMALIRKVLKDTKRHIDILDLGPTVVIVRELLDEVLDCAISLIRSEEEMATGLLEEFVTEATVISCMRKILLEIVTTALSRATEKELMNAEGFEGPLEPDTEGDEEMPPPAEATVETEKPTEETGQADKPAAEDTDEVEKPVEETEQADKPAGEETDETDKPVEETEADKPAENSIEQKLEEGDKPATEEKNGATEEDLVKERPKSAEEGDKDDSKPNEDQESSKPAQGAAEQNTAEGQGDE